MWHCSVHICRASIFIHEKQRVLSVRKEQTEKQTVKCNFLWRVIADLSPMRMLLIAFRYYSNTPPPKRTTILIYVVCLTRRNVTQFILARNCSTYFGWNHHPLSGAQTTVSTASGICHTVTAICRYRGRAGTGLSVLWVAYATHSILKHKFIWENNTYYCFVHKFSFPRRGCTHFCILVFPLDPTVSSLISWPFTSSSAFRACWDNAWAIIVPVLRRCRRFCRTITAV